MSGADPVDSPAEHAALAAEDAFTDLDYTAALLDLVYTAESGEASVAPPRSVLDRAASAIANVTAEGVSAAPERERAEHLVRHAAVQRGGEVASRGPSGRRAGWIGWATAAVAALVALSVWLGPPEPSAASQRARMLATVQDVRTVEWADWDGPEIAGVRGDVVWSDSLQRGYMRFVGLPETDPSVEQFQLWIVDQRGLEDPATGQSARISGGVFDARSASRDPETGALIVPIEPSIRVQGAQLFAVTIEEPGGVWVSDMSRRVVIADASG